MNCSVLELTPTAEKERNHLSVARSHHKGYLSIEASVGKEQGLPGDLNQTIKNKKPQFKKESVFDELKSCTCKLVIRHENKPKSKKVKPVFVTKKQQEVVFSDDEDTIKSQSNQFEDPLLVCGDYCKKLPSKSQKKIIKSIMLREKELYSCADTEHGFLPADKGNLGMRKFLISAAWWQKWLDFTLLGSSSVCSSGNSSRDETTLIRESFQVSAKPGRIENKELLKDAVQLKQDLLENYDFQAVSQEIWHYLASWFGYDFAIQRFVDFDPKTDKTFLRIY